ncbi:hypothetical protein [Chitinophaga niastensis]|uniref:hypothetical protein n=1 Tax=Chitinophaga niastensis TaxID=536980 RepID=UPI000D0DAA0E|nr:hypothetical protein [Chitinophaga niastensis]
MQPWKYPVIIAGDFNAEPDSKVVGKLDAGFIRSCKNGCANTIPSDAPTKIIAKYLRDPFIVVLSIMGC